MKRGPGEGLRAFPRYNSPVRAVPGARPQPTAVMSPETTCWSLIEGAAAGNADDRARFAHRYAPVVRAYLCARWRGSPHLQDVEDAVQEVFIACFREGGVLARADPTRGGGFRPYL